MPSRITAASAEARIARASARSSAGLGHSCCSISSSPSRSWWACSSKERSSWRSSDPGGARGRGGVRGPSRPPGPGPRCGPGITRPTARAPAPWPRRSPPIGFPPPRRPPGGACPKLRPRALCRLSSLGSGTPRSCAMSAIIALLSASLAFSSAAASPTPASIPSRSSLNNCERSSVAFAIAPPRRRPPSAMVLAPVRSPRARCLPSSRQGICPVREDSARGRILGAPVFSRGRKNRARRPRKNRSTGKQSRRNNYVGQAKRQ